ncbi:MAG: DUF937 domain-containing protein [Chitinophagaceae bacterium]
MFENLIKLVRQNAGDTIIDNPAIPNERNDEAVHETGNSIIDTLKQALAGGNVKDVMKIFSGDSAQVNNNPLTRQASGSLIEKLISQFGLDGQQATKVADNLVPNVMNQLSQKTANPSDKSFDIQSIFNHLSGGKTGGMDIQGLLSKFKRGLDTDHDGDVDMQDLKGLF